jgi:hypothetical protein
LVLYERHHCLRDLNMEFLSQGEFIHFFYEEDSYHQSPEAWGSTSSYRV